MEKKKRTFGEVVGYVSGAMVLLACLFAIFTKWDLTFDDQKQKQDTIEAVEHAPTELEKYKQQRQLDTLVELLVKQNKAIEQNTKDLRDTRNHVHHLDSVNKDLQTRTSDQVYQINQKLESRNANR